VAVAISSTLAALYKYWILIETRVTFDLLSSVSNPFNGPRRLNA
jgi:hypothetical protein